MKVEITKVEEFIKAMAAINEITDEASLEFEENGMYCSSLDPSSIAMINVWIPKEFFSVYDASETIGLNFEDFVKILQRMKKDDKIILIKEDSRLIVESVGKSKKRFYLPILDISKNIPKKPELEYKAKIKVISGDLKDIFKDMSLITQYIKIIANNEVVKFYGEGDKGEVEIILDSESECLVSLECEEEQRAMYNLEYLMSFLKPTSNDIVVKMEYTTEAPISLTYYYDDIEINYLLAPRAED